MEGKEAATDKTVAVQAPETGIAHEVVLVESGEGWAVMCPAGL